MDTQVVFFVAKVLIAALVIAGSSSLAARFPVVAGYITALPLTSLLALSFAYAQTGNGSGAAKFAQSIFLAIPVSLLFFVPFLFYNRWKGPFWLYIGSGLFFLYVGFFIQRFFAARLLD